jgi:hypothetical protein
VARSVVAADIEFLFASSIGKRYILCWVAYLRSKTLGKTQFARAQ